jgi:sortase A
VAHRYKNGTILIIVVVIGVVLLATPLMWSLRADRLQSRERRLWNTDTHKYSGQAFRIVVPRIGVDAIVVEETKESDLDRGPMHLAGTAFPGQPGNCCIAAHKEKWFRRLGQLATGDAVMVYSQGKRYEYAIIGQKIVESHNLTVLEDTRAATISLITCTGPAYFGRGKGRLVLIGVLTKVK